MCTVVCLPIYCTVYATKLTYQPDFQLRDFAKMLYFTTVFFPFSTIFSCSAESSPHTTCISHWTCVCQYYYVNIIKHAFPHFPCISRKVGEGSGVLPQLRKQWDATDGAHGSSSNQLCLSITTYATTTTYHLITHVAPYTTLYNKLKR